MAGLADQRCVPDAAADVAQTGSLLYRRLAICAERHDLLTRWFSPRSADCQSAIQQITNLRYDVIGPQGAKPKAEVVADILASIKERRA